MKVVMGFLFSAVSALKMTSCAEVEYDLSKPIVVDFDEGFSAEEQATVLEDLGLWQSEVPEITFDIGDGENEAQTLRIVKDESACSHDGHDSSAIYTSTGIIKICPQQKKET